MPLLPQIQLFPRRAVIEFPKEKSTADALCVVEADDGHRYYVKKDSNGRPTRASEWLSTNLAEAIGISAPAPMLIEMLDKAVVFGSRRVGGVSDDTVTMNFLLKRTVTNLEVPPSVGLTSLLSSIYVFDMFMFNDDRHLGNYLSYEDNGTGRVYAFDFSPCLFWAWPWQGFPAGGTNTRRWGAILRQLHGFDATVAGGTLDRIETLADAAIEGILNQMPADWLRDTLRSEFLDWWSNGLRKSRAEALRKGLIDGTLL